MTFFAEFEVLLHNHKVEHKDASGMQPYVSW